MEEVAVAVIDLPRLLAMPQPLAIPNQSALSKKLSGPRVTRVRQFVSRAWTRAREVFPFTWLGIFVATGSVIALVYFGIQRIDLPLLVVGAVGAAMAVLCLLATSITATALYFSERKRVYSTEPLALECGSRRRTGFSMPSLWYVPFVRIRWKWSAKEIDVALRKDRGRLHEDIIPYRRGVADHIERSITIEDVFGLTSVTFRARESRQVRFTPSMGALKSVHVVRSMSGGQDISHPDAPADGERIDMRYYNPGDPIRFVLWKVYAKSRDLVVRTPERAISPVRQTVAYLVTGEGDEAAAGAARVAVDSGVLGTDWVLGTDGSSDYAKSKTLALDILARSANATEADCGAGLNAFLQRATPASVGRAVVFVPARPGPWLDKVIAAARMRTGQNSPVSPVEFVVCTDGVRDVAEIPKWKRLASRPAKARPEDGSLTDTEALTQVVDALSTARARVLVLDRKLGRVYDGRFARGKQGA